MRIYGRVTTLPDLSEIRLILQPHVHRERRENRDSERVDYHGYFPNRPQYRGTLAAKQTVVIDSLSYYIVEERALVNGWIQLQMNCLDS